MSSLRTISGVVHFESDAAQIEPILSVLVARFKPSTPQSQEKGDGTTEDGDAIDELQFPILLTFREARREALLERFKPALGRLADAVSDSLQSGAISVASKVVPGAGVIAAVAEWISEFARRNPKDPAGADLATILSRVDLDELSASIGIDSLKERIKVPGLEIDWKRFDEDQWREVLAAVRSGFRAEPPAFKLTQLSGWMSSEKKDEGYRFTIAGAVRFADAIYHPDARLDILGLDGSQLATKRLAFDELIGLVGNESTSGVEIRLPADGNLRRALARAGEVRRPQATQTIAGRAWSRDGLPLANRQIAFYAPPALSRPLDGCSDDGLWRQATDSCCDVLESAEVVIRTPIALAFGHTDENGYFECVFNEPPSGLEYGDALVQIGGVRASLAVALEAVTVEGSPRFRFPDLVLIQVEPELIVDRADRAVQWIDSEEDCKCRGISFGDANRTLESFNYDLIIRTTDPMVTRGGIGDDSGSALGVGRGTDSYFRAQIDRRNQMAWDEDPVVAQAVTISHGRILTVRQAWKADGYSLGDLLYSLPLAPLQKKNIAVIDWERDDSATRSEDLDYSESLSNVVARERDISEIVNSTLKESIRAKSSSRGRSGSGGFGVAVGPISFGRSGGSSGASSSSRQDSTRTLASNFVNQLRDQTSQAASAFRSQRVTTVQQVHQSETTRVVTETVANRNACHAITIQYFEVLRHFEIAFELAQVRECLFIPLPIAPFDAAKALRWRGALMRYLPEQSLIDGMDACQRLLQAKDPAPPPQQPKNGNILRGQLTVSLSITMPGDFVDDAKAAGNLSLDELPGEKAALIAMPPTERDRYFQTHIAPKIAKILFADLTLTLADGTELDVELDAPDTHGPGARAVLSFDATSVPVSVAVDQPCQVKVSRGVAFGTMAAMKVHGLALWVAAGEKDVLMRDRSARGRVLSQGAALPLALKRIEADGLAPAVADTVLCDRLLSHLNEHLEAYHRAIWWEMDPERRFTLLDGFVAPHSGGRSVASVVENRLAGVIGNCIVMPVAPGLRLDYYRDDEHSDPAAGGDDLLALYRPAMPVPPIRISVPTKGVFAESVMGTCNSCERIDDSRNWRHWEHPLPDEPAAIEPISTGSRYQRPEVQPVPAAQPIINQVQTFPTAPEPTSMAKVFEFLAGANAFRDATGLGGTQAFAQSGLSDSFSTTRRFGEIAAELAMHEKELAARLVAAYLGAPTPPSDKPKVRQSDGEQLKKSIAKDAAAGRVSQDQAKGAIARINSAMAESLVQRPSLGLVEDPEISNAIGTASSKGQPVTVTRGDSRVEIGGAAVESGEPEARGGRSRWPWPLRLLGASSADAAPVRSAQDPDSVFRDMWDAMKRDIGPDEIYEESMARLVDNMCATRVSFAINQAGLGRILHRARDATRGLDGRYYMPGAEKLAAQLDRAVGKATRIRPATGYWENSALSGRKGILFFRDYWKRATDRRVPTGDHIDLWDGATFPRISEASAALLSQSERRAGAATREDSYYVDFWPIEALVKGR